ncbi:hypothetical protein FRC07_010737, partial [Ceratobasidium sp. 392]
MSDAKTHDEALQTGLEVLSEHGMDCPFVALYRCNSDDTWVRPYRKGGDPRKPKTLIKMKFMKATLNLVGAVGIPDNHPATPKSI